MITPKKSIICSIFILGSLSAQHRDKRARVQEGPVLTDAQFAIYLKAKLEHEFKTKELQLRVNQLTEALEGKIPALQKNITDLTEKLAAARRRPDAAEMETQCDPASFIDATTQVEIAFQDQGSQICVDRSHKHVQTIKVRGSLRQR